MSKLLLGACSKLKGGTIPISKACPCCLATTFAHITLLMDADQGLHG